MSETMKKAVSGTKKTVWKYFGAMMMEQKDGGQAVSFTRTLAIVLFFSCLFMWHGVIGESSEVPGDMLYTLWGLIGIKGAKDVAARKA